MQQAEIGTIAAIITLAVMCAVIFVISFRKSHSKTVGEYIASHSLMSYVYARKFHSEYGISVPHGSLVTYDEDDRDCDGVFTLYFPYWLHADANGNMDRRYIRNRLVYDGCCINIGGFELLIADPIETYSIVKKLRESGHQVKYRKTKRSKLRDEGDVQFSVSELQEKYPQDIVEALLDH